LCQEDDEKYFGHGFKTQDKNLKRWVDQMDTMIESEDVDATLLEMRLLKKQVNSIRSVCAVYNKTNAARAELQKEYTDKVAFLRMNPEAENPFPLFLKIMIHNRVVMASSSSKDRCHWCYTPRKIDKSE